jgi:hypothetical protein
MRPLKDANISQLQGQVFALMEKIQDLTLPKVGRPQVWCTGCYTEDCIENEYPRLRGMGPSNMASSPVGPT